MIIVAQAIVYESAVVIKFLNAVLAMSAVEGPPRFYHSAIKAKVVQVNTLFVGQSQKFLKTGSNLKSYKDITIISNSCLT